MGPVENKFIRERVRDGTEKIRRNMLLSSTAVASAAAKVYGKPFYGRQSQLARILASIILIIIRIELEFKTSNKEIWREQNPLS